LITTMSAKPQVPARCPVHEAFDPLSADFLADPYAAMASLPLNEQPVFYAPSLDYYVVSRYADVEAVFLDTESYSAATAQLPLVPLIPEALRILAEGGHRPQPSMVSLDQPEHTRLRRPASRAFTPRRVAAMEPRIHQTLDELLDGLDPAEPFDLVSTLTFPLPATIVFSFMGVPAEDWARLKDWCGSRAALAWGRPYPDEQVEHATNMAAYRGYLRELVASKVDDRADDYVSALLAIHDEEPDALTHEEIASILFSLSFAGHETTNYLIGNLVRRLLEDRSRWEAIVADPALAAGAVDEILRFDTSVPVWRRIAKRPVTLGGVDLPEGAKLFLWLAATGHDPDVFPEPERFDPRRENAHHHLAFGKGVHYCAGASLGKLEARLALEGLVQRFPDLRLVEGQEIPFHPNISFRGPLELWVDPRG
jgi:cytochrome P450